jgi:hypothetical protein
MPLNKFKRIAWVVIALSTVLLVVGLNIKGYVNKKNREALITENAQKIKPGMTYLDVISLLGVPDVILFSESSDVRKFKERDLRNGSSITFQFDSKTKPGELNWIYINYNNTPGFPVYTFDSSTGKLIRTGKRSYDT